jgi:hypothetical protein
MKSRIILIAIVLAVFAQDASGQSKRKGVLSDFTENLMSEESDIEFREIFEQYVVQWALKEGLFTSGDIVEIKLLVGVQKSESNSAASMFLKYKVNEEASEIVIIELSPKWWNENGVVFSKMKISIFQRALIEDMVFTMIEAMSESGLSSRTEEGLIITASKSITGQNQYGEQIKSVSTKDFSVTLKDLYSIGMNKVKFNVPEPYKKAEITLKYLNSDQHVFYQMRNENYILDYTEKSVNLFNKLSKNHIRISNFSIETIVEEILN